MATSVEVTGAWTTMNSGGVGFNNALAGRLHDSGLFYKSTFSDVGAVRGGVIPSAYTSTFTDYACIKGTSTSSLQVQVFPGMAMCPVSGQGAYAIYNQAIQTVTLDTAHATLTRIDRLDLQIQDTTSSVGGGYIVITNGIPSGSPVAAAAPSNSVPLCTVTVPPNNVNSVNLTVTDIRTSAGLAGTIRPMMGGDTLAAAGQSLGELRDNGTGIDRWNGTIWQPVWYGTNRGMTTVGKSNTVTNLTGNTEYQLLFDTAIDSSAEATFTSNTTMTLNVAGKWRLSGRFTVANSSGSSGYANAIIASSTASGTNFLGRNSSPFNTATDTSCQVDVVANLAAGTAWSVWIRCGTGNVTLNQSTARNNTFQAQWLGP